MHTDHLSRALTAGVKGKTQTCPYIVFTSPHGGYTAESQHPIVLNISATLWPKWIHVAVTQTLCFSDPAKMFCSTTDSLTQTITARTHRTLARSAFHLITLFPRGSFFFFPGDRPHSWVYCVLWEDLHSYITRKCVCVKHNVALNSIQWVCCTSAPRAVSLMTL